MKNLWLRRSVVGVLFLLASCVGQTVVQITTTGTFNLRRFNDEELPYFETLTQPAGCQVSLEGGSLWLFQDKTFELNLDVFAQDPACRTAGRAKWPQKTTGTYESSGTSLRLVSNDGATTYEGSLNGGSGASLVGSLGKLEFGR